MMVDQVFEHEHQNKKGYFEHESRVCVSAEHSEIMYNHDNCDFICYLGGHFFYFQGENKK